MYELELIRIVKVYKPLFQTPYKIGDILEIKGYHHLILGIQQFRYYHFKKELEIKYITQRLEQTYKELNYPAKPLDYVQGWITYDVKEFEQTTCPIELGKLLYSKPMKTMFRIISYTHIEYEEKKLKVWVALEPIHPVNPMNAKKIYKEMRKKQLEVLSFDYTEKEGDR